MITRALAWAQVERGGLFPVFSFSQVPWKPPEIFGASIEACYNTTYVYMQPIVRQSPSAFLAGVDSRVPMVFYTFDPNTV
jgi:hypothetical protein